MILVSDGIVLELQRDCLNASASISAILRKAKAIASKLDLDELVEWFDQELNGYECQMQALPPHRKGVGAPKFKNPYHGWCPIMAADDEFGNAIRTGFLPQPISELESLAAGPKSDLLIMGYHPVLEQAIQRQLPTPMECALHFPQDQVRSALDFVRNKVLDWTLALEKRGITGEGFTFNSQEKEDAVAVTNHIYNSTVGVIGAVSGNATISNLTTVSGSVDFARVHDLLTQITEAKGALPKHVASDLEAPLKDLEEGAKQKNGTKVKAALVAMIPILQGAAGNIVAAGILSAIGAG